MLYCSGKFVIIQYVSYGWSGRTMKKLSLARLSFARKLLFATFFLNAVVFLALMNAVFFLEGKTGQHRDAFLIAIKITGIALFLLVSLFVSKMFSAPLEQLLKSCYAIARGNLDQRITLSFSEEWGVVASAINQLLTQLRSHKITWEKQSRNSGSLNYFAGLIHSHLEVEVLLPTLCEKMKELMQVKEVLLFGVDKNNRKLVPWAAAGIADERLAHVQFAVGEGLAGWAAKTGEAVFLNNPSADERFKTVEGGSSIESILCAPLVGQDGIVGVLSVANKTDAMPFTDQDLQFFTTLTPHIAQALENAQLYQLAITDELTGLYSVRYFKHRLEKEMKRAYRYKQPLSLLMMDLDHFKKVNDTYGHLTGDGVLKEAARRIRKGIRDVDIACRYGGEEFCALLPETDLKGAEILAERLRVSVCDAPMNENSHEISLTISVGVAALADGETKEKFIEDADSALYRAKQEGRNKVVVVANNKVQG